MGGRVRVGVAVRVGVRVIVGVDVAVGGFVGVGVSLVVGDGVNVGTSVCVAVGGGSSTIDEQPLAAPRSKMENRQRRNSTFISQI